jgi:hypothetical protein
MSISIQIRSDMNSSSVSAGVAFRSHFIASAHTRQTKKITGLLITADPVRYLVNAAGSAQRPCRTRSSCRRVAE